MKLKISGFAVGLLLSKCDSVTDLKAQGGKGHLQAVKDKHRTRCSSTCRR